MSPILASIAGGEDPLASSLPNVVDKQASEHALGFRITSDWSAIRDSIDRLLTTDVTRATQVLGRLVETLDLYAPTLKGLHDVHAYACERLEKLTLGRGGTSHAAAYLYGHALGLSPLTSEAVSLAIENLLLGDTHETAICVILGTQRATEALFKSHLPTLLRQVQLCAFQAKDVTVTQEALMQAMKLFTGENETSVHILKATHALWSASLLLCKAKRKNGLFWACYIICNTPMLLRNSLRANYPIDAAQVFDVLSEHFDHPEPILIAALPILTTWDTAAFCANGQVERIVRFLQAAPPPTSFASLGQLASVVLDRFSPYVTDVAEIALANLSTYPSQSQLLLKQLLASLGPIMLEVMTRYLEAPARILLTDVRLLQMLAALLPNLSANIVQGLCDVIDATVAGADELHESLLSALTVFPLCDTKLASKAQHIVLWSLDENKSRAAILNALQLAIDPYIAPPIARPLTYKTAQLLLADDPHIVHMALSTLSNPLLASMLDEKSCQMILLALHQSLEPSIQIVAAKLLAHLCTEHRGIIQPLAWNHIRQSLGLVEFLQDLDPARAIVEACIISNLLPALPPSVRKKYTRTVKERILIGLDQPQEGHTLSLIFQGLANLAKFDTWQKAQQTQLAIDLLDMSQEIPRDSQHAALNAIARLLTVPQQDDAYDMLLNVHATFRKRDKLDPDLKSLIAGIYGHLGTVERNPVISRDSKAAINRERSVYDSQVILASHAAEAMDKGSGVEWLVAKTLTAALDNRKGDSRLVLLEVMTSLGILQPKSISALIPNLPVLISNNVENDATRASIVFLAAALHASDPWIEQNWAETAKLMSSCMEQDALSVLKGVDILLDAL